jgi:pseudouridine kinase
MSLQQEGHVLVIGAAGIDIKARTLGLPAWNTSNLGMIRNNVGGVARNIAENLARLEVPTILLSAIGRDTPGKRVLMRTREGGVNCAHVRRVSGGRTGNYVALFDQNSKLLIAISDYEIMETIDTEYLLRHEDLFADAIMIVIDANLSLEALETVFQLAQRYRIRICADPTTPELAGKLCPYLDQLFLVTPNRAETAALCGLDDTVYDRDTAISAARQLVTLGVELAVVTLGEQGLAYADSSGGGYIRSVRTQIVDPTGAGDAFSGAVIFGLLNDVPVDEAMRLGVTAASLTLQNVETVVPELSQELLYARLVV